MTDTPKISVEHFTRVYDDMGGWYVQIGSDRDGLDLCEILYREGNPDKGPEILLPWAHAKAVARAILELADKVTE